MLSPLLVFPLKIPIHSPCSPTHPLLLPGPGIPLYLWNDKTFTGPRVSPPIGDWLGHPLLHIQLEPWVPPCVFFDRWFSSKELWEYWLIHIDVPPMGLQTPSAPWVLSLALGTLWSVQWMAVSLFFCICQALAEPLKRLYIRILSAKTCLQERTIYNAHFTPFVGFLYL